MSEKMGFSDEELKKLKAVVPEDSGHPRDKMLVPTFQLRAFLARLEAAETVVRHDAEIRASQLTFYEKELIGRWKESCGRK